MKITYYHFERLDSTNSWAKRNLRLFSKDEIAIISAQEQTEGHGRWERSWISPKDKSLLISFVLKGKYDPFFIGQLACLITKQFLMQKGIEAALKWPNDLLIEDAKIAGVLVEYCPPYIICGIGLNVNETLEDLAMIERATTSLLQEGKGTSDIEKIKKEFVELFLLALDRAMKNKQEIQNQWAKELQWMEGKELKVSSSKGTFRGIVKHIQEDGTLILKSDGKIISFVSGEI
jgi:BirA family transcriptional regulator, biotin operon repressor / biotin---[acetyl-CoA-carboxylase] ligase